ncbi:COQ9 family protein [Yoonia sp. R2-816]|uniref:COQ9 family protein n=1 Tax=Yoonia sp. R2-816 TaxID=3342638 RepID=UPI00372962CA
MMTAPIDPAKDKLIDAILPHVAFDGWAPVAFNAAVAEVGLDPAHAKTLCPRGAVDLAVAYHQRGDGAMVAALKQADMSDMRFRDKVAHALRLRIRAIDDKEAVRRGTALFALPHMAPDGTKLIWGTADAIWDALGDTSRDINWYTKRMTLSGVYGSVVLYWLGDDSLDGQATDAFIDRRIDDVMQFEKVKAQVKQNPLLKPVTGPLSRMLGAIKAPTKVPPVDLPGMWRDQT